VPLFVGSYLAVWVFVGVAVYALYRPHGLWPPAWLRSRPALTSSRRSSSTAARAAARGAPLGSGSFGLQCVGSSIGLMLVALGAMSVAWMSVIAVLVLAQKAARESRQRCAAGPGDRRT
jgi:Predicted metal-binding integral membrane protein (DUF2182)